MAPPKKPPTTLIRVRVEDRDRLAALCADLELPVADVVARVLDHFTQPLEVMVDPDEEDLYVDQGWVAVAPPLVPEEKPAPPAPAQRQVTPLFKRGKHH